MTTKKDISNWFDQGIKISAKYMLVVCDTFDHDDYPVFSKTADDCLSSFKNPGEMQRVMEVYDLNIDKEEQLREHRAMHLPVAGIV